MILRAEGVTMVVWALVLGDPIASQRRCVCGKVATDGETCPKTELRWGKYSHLIDSFCGLRRPAPPAAR
jgi:hypothetical protein